MKVEFKKKNILIITISIVAVVVVSLSLGLGLGLSNNEETVPQKTYGWGAREYLADEDNWNLTYQDDAESATLVNLPNREKYNQKANAIYELLVYAFSDGDGDGIGDFIGAANHLDYLDALNINSLWLSPFNEAPSYHGYDVMDYVSVSRELGGMRAFDRFLREAHNRGIKVYMDLVFNHTSAKHPWFQKALAGDSKYESYYQFRNNANGHSQDVDASPGKSFVANNWVGMPDLNGANSDVLKELEYIIQFWVKKGIDGFRFDLFRDLYGGGEPWPEGITNPVQHLFANLKEIADNTRSDIGGEDRIFFLGEGKLNENPLSSMSYLTDGNRAALNSIYDGGFLRGVSEVPLTYHSIQEYNNILTSLINKRSGVNDYEGTWTPFLDNHDESRWIQNFRQERSDIHYPDGKNYPMDEDDWTALKYGLSVMLLFPGKPIFFQGDELGYHGVKPPDSRIREPILWSNEHQIKFQQYRAYGETNKFDDYGNIQLDLSSDITSADIQLHNPSSIVNSFIKVAKIRGKYQWLKDLENPFIPLSTTNSVASNSLYIGLIREHKNHNEQIILLESTKVIDAINGIQINEKTYDFDSYFTNHGWSAEVLLSEHAKRENNKFILEDDGMIILRLTK